MQADRMHLIAMQTDGMVIDGMVIAVREILGMTVVGPVAHGAPPWYDPSRGAHAYAGRAGT